MAPSGSAMATACRSAADQLRALPAVLRRDLPHQVETDVAEPLAAQIAKAWRGPHAAALATATKARMDGDPQIVIGGARRLLSGGATASDLVFGDEYGGGNRVGRVSASRRARAHRRHTTRQFPRGGQHAIARTVTAHLDDTYTRWVGAVDQLIAKAMPHG